MEYEMFEDELNYCWDVFISFPKGDAEWLKAKQWLDIHDPPAM